MSFAVKYGKEFVAAATELMPDCGVNRQIIELLSVQTPSVEMKLKLLKEIAEEHEVDWDPASTETEFLKPNEDLLNGPNHISTSPSLPLPLEKDIAFLKKTTDEESQESDLDSGLDFLDLPEVPKGSLQSSSDSPQSTIVHLRPPPPPLFFSELEQEETKNVPSHTSDFESENPTASLSAKENKQFIPFVSPPSDTVYAKQAETSPSPAGIDPDAKINLQDVLAAAQASAETAERAAAAAHAAASLTQMRITELSVKKKTKDSNGFEKEMNEAENPTWKQDNSVDLKESAPSWDSGSPNLSSHNLPKTRAASPEPTELILDHHTAHHKTLRSTSLEDDPYFSFPNLFADKILISYPGFLCRRIQDQHMMPD